MLSDPYSFKIDDNAFEFLALQKGRIHSFLKDRGRWEKEYNLSLFSDYETIKPYLPQTCRKILDIGSGLGGINALINKHYGGDASVFLVDGIADLPKMVLHRETYNNMSIAKSFLQKNGVEKFSFIDPKVANDGNFGKFDVILSLGSYCFHYSPKTYLGLVKKSCHRDTVLIFDFRKGKPDWKQIFSWDFVVKGFAKSSEKFDRIVLRPK